MNKLAVLTKDGSRTIIFTTHLYNKVFDRIDMQMEVLNEDLDLIYEKDMTWTGTYFREPFSGSGHSGTELVKAWIAHLIIETSML